MCQSKFQLVGSLLRPADLLTYKNKIQHRDDIQYPFYEEIAGYQAVEQAKISQIVQEQIDHQIDILTDGEFSKSMWHLDFVWGLTGIERFIAEHGYPFQNPDGTIFETRKDIGLRITAPLSGKNHHFLEIYQGLQKQAQEKATKLTVWGAAHAFVELAVFNHAYGEGQVYTTKEELKAGLIAAYKEFLTEYKALGGEIVQFDDCLWELFDESNDVGLFANEGATLDELADEFVAINNAVADYGHELGLKVWTHNCRGNYQSRHASGGTYQAIAEKFLRDQNYDRFFLEWDDDRAGDLDALEVLREKEHVEVVLGLLSSKTNTLDDEQRAFSLLEKASTIIPKERLFLSHQCGFASCDEGNELSVAEQWAKIEQGQAIAKEFFAN
ncbi:MAG: cobalamin-independent methionine synthase II family protein [Enterococcus sp.]